MMHKVALPLLLAGAGSASAALQVDFGSSDSIKAAAKDVAADLMAYYRGNETGEIPGIFPPPPESDFYWFTGALLWSTMIDYWHYTGDDSYNAVALEGLVHQNGPSLASAFMPTNWTATMGNDDHGLWGMLAMLAAELNFPSAPQGEPSWIELAEAVFGLLAARWAEDDVCDGGLRWQIMPTNFGYNLKNTLANAIFINLGARLARYTGNQTYAVQARQTWDWLTAVGLVDESFNVFDGTLPDSDCSDIIRYAWSNNAAVLIQAAAYMYNQTTGDDQSTWQSVLTGLTNRTLSVFFPDRIHVEVACEGVERTTCNSAMRFFKGVTLRSLASVVQLAPFLRGTITSGALRGSAEAAVEACDQGASGRECGFRWAGPAETVEGQMVGAPEQMNALSALVSMLVDEAAGKGFATAEDADQVGGDGGGDDGGNGGDGEDQAGEGAGQGDGNGDQNGNGNENENQNGDGDSAGVRMSVALGWVVVGLVAALL
ncbi:Mannan endo-1,6-alpha-mannosidase [Madurella fahalii]|uniref:Mannan endo-1,6-alpha-mannosidase n=1 Tax=Madurella fahalii TaxID=1157608 RepID=A0ABQ0GNK0_9PEZI